MWSILKQQKHAFYSGIWTFMSVCLCQIKWPWDRSGFTHNRPQTKYLITCVLPPEHHRCSWALVCKCSPQTEKNPVCFPKMAENEPERNFLMIFWVDAAHLHLRFCPCLINTLSPFWHFRLLISLLGWRCNIICLNCHVSEGKLCLSNQLFLSSL